jgi:hypothetical protein
MRRPYAGRVASYGGVVYVMLLLLLLLAPSAVAEERTAREYQIKAAFLLNFVRFVEWPATAFPAPDTALRIGVLGDDPFGSALDDTVRGEMVRNRPLVVQRGRTLEELTGCHLIFVSRSEQAKVPEIIAYYNRQAVLMVSDIEDFANRGGTIDFFLDGKKLRFAINQTSAQQQSLKPSAQLLSLGKIVAPLREEERR